jgi:acetylglutamate kinase
MPNSYATPIVVKYGGNAMDPQTEEALLTEVVRLHASDRPVVLVHGGGPEIDRWLGERGVQTDRVDGMRVTTAATLEVTEAVLCATINKRLVRVCTGLGAKAAGISGEDGGTIVARELRGRHGEDLGLVGETVASDPLLIRTLLEGGFLPIVAPLAISQDATHAFNVNADLAAAAVAAALNANAFIVITNVERVRRDPKDPQSGIERMTLDEARAFLESPACEGGMFPKMQAVVSAVENGAAAAYICAAGPDAIEHALANASGTLVSR